MIMVRVLVMGLMLPIIGTNRGSVSEHNRGTFAVRESLGCLLRG